AARDRQIVADVDLSGHPGAVPTPHDARTADDAVPPSVATERAPVRLRTLAPAVGVSLSAFLLFGAHVRPLGWFVLAAAVGLAWAVDRRLGKDLTLIGLGISIVSTT